MKTFQLMMLVIAVTLAGTQAQPDPSSFGRNALIGAWHLVRIEAPGSDEPQPKGMLICTRDGHMSVQLMFPKSASASDDEYVLGGYEASFGSYDVDEGKHIITHHVQGSITRNLLVGKDLPRAYQLTADGHLIIRSADLRQHWSVNLGALLARFSGDTPHDIHRDSAELGVLDVSRAIRKLRLPDWQRVNFRVADNPGAISRGVADRDAKCDHFCG